MALMDVEHLEKWFDRKTVHAVRDFSLAIDEGDFVVLVGSSGCGKSTILRLIAGLETPDAGKVLLQGRDITRARPAERNVAMVFQDYALYPHLSAFDNIAFPLKAQKVSRSDQEKRVRAVSRTLDIEDILDRKPPKLSGGQQQRVAIGRALVRNPSIFLMDEPLSNLDAKLRAHMRGELARIHRNTGATMLYVTHDQIEAMTLATKIVVMDKGAIQQVGTPAEVYLKPRTAFVAGFVGSPSMNLAPCRVVCGTLRFKGAVLAFPSGNDAIRRRYEGRELLLGIRPEHLSLACPDADLGLMGSREAVVGGRYLRAEIIGSDAFISVDAQGSVLAAKTNMQNLSRLQPNAAVQLKMQVGNVFLFDPATGENALV